MPDSPPSPAPGDARAAQPGDPVIYHLDDGDTVPGIFQGWAGLSSTTARLRVLFSGSMKEKYSGRPDWFASDYMEHWKGCPPECCDMGTAPGEFEFASLSRAASSEPAAEPAKHETGGAASLQHELDLIDADTVGWMTDCSTPVFIRVRNIIAELSAAHAKLAEARKTISDREAEIYRIRTTEVNAACQLERIGLELGVRCQGLDVLAEVRRLRAASPPPAGDALHGQLPAEESDAREDKP